MAWWSTAGLLHAFVTGPWSLASFRFLLGIGEAGNWPAGVKVVAEWFPASERALACGIFNSGAAIGAIAAPPLMTWLVLSHGWPTAFVVVGLTGYVWLVGWWFVYRRPEHVRAEATARPAPAWRLFRTRFALISMATFGYTGFNSNTLAYPPDVFPKNMVGSIWGLASMGAGFGGMLFSWLSGRLIDQYGYTPVFVGYGIMPLISLALVLFALGPIEPHPDFVVDPADPARPAA